MAETEQKTTPTSSESENKSANQQNVTTVPREKKFNDAVWVLLGTAAIIIDLAQGADFLITLGTVGTVVNMLADIFIGLSLATLFLIKGMLDWKLGISLILGFAVDFLTAGIAPAWSIDILYAWLVTDGATTLGRLPMGETIQQAALVTVAKSKKPEFRKELSTVEGFKKSMGEEIQNRTKPKQLENNENGKSVDGIRQRTDTQTNQNDKFPGVETNSGRMSVKKRMPNILIESRESKEVGEDKQPIRFGGNYWRKLGETRRQRSKERATEEAAGQYGLGREEAERHAGKSWSNN